MAKCATREAYGKALAQLIQENERVIVLDADLAGSTKTSEAKKVCPQRHFDVGIAEGNMMGIAAGLSTAGKVPFAASISSLRPALRCLRQEEPLNKFVTALVILI